MAKANVNTNLKDYLEPGTGTIPPVNDPSGNPVTQITKESDESVSVDVGSSPNSNTGDPLRIAFVKINNFIEAGYQQSIAMDAKFRNYDSDLYDPITGEFTINGGTF